SGGRAAAGPAARGRVLAQRGRHARQEDRRSRGTAGETARSGSLAAWPGRVALGGAAAGLGNGLAALARPGNAGRPAALVIAGPVHGGDRRRRTRFGAKPERCRRLGAEAPALRWPVA